MSALLTLMRRECWEHRAVWMVPAVLGVLIVLAALAAVGVTQSWRGSATVRVITLSEQEAAIERSRDEIGRLAGELAAIAADIASDRTAAALGEAARQAGEHARRLEEALRGAGSGGDAEAVRALEEEAARAEAHARALERELGSTAAPPAPPAPPVAPAPEAPAAPPAAEAAPPAPGTPAARRAEIERLRSAIALEARRIAEHERRLQQATAEAGGGGEGDGLTLREFVAKYANVDRQRMREVAADLMFSSAGVFFLVTVWVMFFYALAALYDERKDRSALFWKSLPVSDLVTVASKAVTALFTAPLFAFAATAVTQLLLMLMATLVVWQLDLDPWALVWRAASPWTAWPQVLASFLVQSLWLAPVIGWALLVSAWARRTPVLYALLVPAVISLLEFLVFRTSHLATGIGERVARGVLVVVHGAGNAAGEVTVSSTIRAMDAAAIGAMLATPALWIGLAVTVAFVAGAVWIRRFRDEA